MARALTAGMLTAIATGIVKPIFLYEAEFASGTVNLFTGHGTLNWDSKTWTGDEGLMRIESAVETSDLAALNFTVSLNGQVSSLLSLALGQVRRGKPGSVWLGLMGREVVESGTAQAGAASTLTLRAAASAVDDVFNGKYARLVSGPGSVQERTITGYVGATKVATVSPRWRTNKILHSEALDNVAWLQDNATVDANVATDPDGGLGMDRIVAGAVATRAGIYQNASVVQNETYTSTAYLKKDNTRYVMVTDRNDPVWHTVTVDLDTGVITNTFNASGVIEDIGGGIYRVSCIWSRVNASGTGGVNVYLSTISNPQSPPAMSGAGTEAVFAWGLQMEHASTPGDYIKTEAAAITLPDATTDYEVIDENGIIPDPFLCFKGRADKPAIVPDPNSCVVGVAYESRLIDAARRRERRYTKEDQSLDFPNDLGFDQVPSLQDTVLTFGRR